MTAAKKNSSSLLAFSSSSLFLREGVVDELALLLLVDLGASSGGRRGCEAASILLQIKKEQNTRGKEKRIRKSTSELKGGCNTD
jgi:hypothetical protein